jgi:hypothetical protein
LNPNHARTAATSQPPDAPVAGERCRILVLQTIRANRLHELAAVCAKLRQLAPGCSIAAVVTPEVQGIVAALGCADQLLLSTGGRWALLRQVRAARFEKVCVVNDGGGAPGQLRDDILALAARPAQLLWCTSVGAVRMLGRARLLLRISSESVLMALAFGAAAALAMPVAVALAGAALVGGVGRPRRSRV